MVSKKNIEEEIVYHLKNNDPESAKNVYDQWHMKKEAHPSDTALTDSDLKDLATLF